MIQLNYKSFGQGPPLIIVHGLFGTLDNWQTIAKQFSTSYSVFLIDQRNHGRSPHVDGLFNYKILAEDLKEFMEQNWIYKASLIGHSMGGKTILQFAAEYPEMIDKMVVVDIGPKIYEGGHEIVLEALAAVPIETLADRQQAEQILWSKIGEMGTVQFLLKNLSRKKEGGFEWKMNLKNLVENYSNILAAIEKSEPCMVETLFIRGGRSNYITESDYPLLLQQYPNSTVATIEDAGHWVHADKPQELYTLASQFLNK